MSLLGLDWGARYVGYATSDEDGLVITPRAHFERKVSKSKTWVLQESDKIELSQLIQKWEIEKIVLGLPLHADGRESDASLGAKELALELKKSFSLEVILIDERLTSWEAGSSDNSHANAAALILKNYFLDLQKKHR